MRSRVKPPWKLIRNSFPISLAIPTDQRTGKSGSVSMLSGDEHPPKTFLFPLQIVLYVSSRVLASFLPRLLSSIRSHPSPIPTTQSPSLLSKIFAPLTPLRHPLPSLTSPAGNPKPIPPADLPFALFTALSWGLVMYIYRHHGERLQPGMVNSMSELGEGDR